MHVGWPVIYKITHQKEEAIGQGGVPHAKHSIGSDMYVLRQLLAMMTEVKSMYEIARKFARVRYNVMRIQRYSQIQTFPMVVDWTCVVAAGGAVSQATCTLS